MTTLITPSTISSDLIPTIVNLEEARERCGNFAAVLTAGPSRIEVADFDHSNHKVVEFDDVTSAFYGHQPPTYRQVEEMVRWGTGQTQLLVHCHAGMSRSTATAWGIAIANGLDPAEAFTLLKNNHPLDIRYAGGWSRQIIAVDSPRPFIPNRLIVEHLETLFTFRAGTLGAIVDRAN